MLSFFPTPYKDEILYSVCARYHMRASNLHYSVTMKELFGENYISSKLLFPTALERLSENLPINSKITKDKLLNECTPFNYFSLFLSKERKNRLKNAMISNDGYNATSFAGLGKDLTMFKYLRFCRECVKEDILKYGEAYWHQIHQIPGVYVCPHHKIPTQDSNCVHSDVNRSSFHSLDEDYCLSCEEIKMDSNELKKMFTIACKINDCLNFNKQLNWDIIDEVYNDYLIFRGYMHPSGRLYREKIVNAFNAFYGKDVLSKLGYPVKLEKKTSWFFKLLKNPKEEGNPIRHILLIIFLGLDFDFKIDKSIKYLPFGEGPWCCLNPVCNHYKKPVIKEIELKFDSRNDNVAANFKCMCGYKYTRVAPYDHDKDKYTYRYVLEYGALWEERLKDMATSGQYNLKSTCEIFNCSSALIIRNLNRLGIVPTWSIGNAYSDKKMEFTNRNRNMKLRDKHRNAWLKAQECNPNYGITELIETLKGHYKWLNKNDKQWLIENSPEKKDTVSNYVANWEQRDSVLFNTFEKIIQEELNKEEIPTRITKNWLFRKSNLSNMITIDIDKIPKTKKLLNDSCEDLEAYHKRRLKWASKYVFDNGLTQTYENIFAHAKIGQNYFLKYKSNKL